MFDYLGSPPSVQGNTMAPVRTNGVNAWRSSSWPQESSDIVGYIHPETLQPRMGKSPFIFSEGDRITVELSERLQAEGITPSDTEWLRMCKAAEEARGIHCNYEISPERPKRPKASR